MKRNFFTHKKCYLKHVKVADRHQRIYTPVNYHQYYHCQSCQLVVHAVQNVSFYDTLQNTAWHTVQLCIHGTSRWFPCVVTCFTRRHCPIICYLYYKDYFTIKFQVCYSGLHYRFIIMQMSQLPACRCSCCHINWNLAFSCWPIMCQHARACAHEGDVSWRARL